MHQCAESDVEQYSLTPQTLDKENLEPCTQQESDGRIILHVADAASQGYRNIKVATIQFPAGGGGADIFFEINTFGGICVKYIIYVL